MSLMDEARQTFVQESEELLQEMEDALLSMEQAPDDEEYLNSVFRAMHTIKGAAGVFGYDSIVAFTHPIETELDRVRSGVRVVDSALVAVLLESKDHTASLVGHVLSGPDADLPAALQQRGEALLAQVQGAGPGTDEPAAAPVAAETVNGQAAENADWLLVLNFGPDALRNGLDPLSFIRYLATLGELVEVVCLLRDAPPELGAMDPERCYLGFCILLSTAADQAAIEGAFEFLQDDCEIHIVEPGAEAQAWRAPCEGLAEAEQQRLLSVLQQRGLLTAAVDAAPAQPAMPVPAVAATPATVDNPPAPPKSAGTAQTPPPRKVATAGGLEARNIRVDSAKLGQLINLVGELVISSAAMRLMVDRQGGHQLEEVVSTVEHLVENIRDTALQLRMVQIGETFSRFRRVVRDVSNELGKQIELQITGGDSELDKTVVEKINDPLTHLVRNSLDHGIELPEQRLASGKPAGGVVSLNAYHDSGHIVIEIRDDGAGLDPQRIRAKAEAIGLVRADQELSRQQIFKLIFEPGLSTKREASSLSGRGVGMDVVRRNIEALRGSIELDSEQGKGTVVTIHLPLTLAIIDGFLVGVAGEAYIIPLSMVEECVEMASDQWQLDDSRRYVNLRDQLMPCIRLRDFFSLPSVTGQGRESLVVVRAGRQRAGLVVDALFGEQQTVIKPLGKVFQQLKGVSGATVLGSGGIALILDVQGMISLACEQHSAVLSGSGVNPAVAEQ